MKGYALTNELAGSKQAVSSSFKTLINLSAATSPLLARAAVHELILGIDGTPADQAMAWDLSRTTAIGTGTSATPTKLDPADGASPMVGTVNHTGEPTVTGASSMLSIALNQRTTHRWVANPGHEIIVPPTDVNGVALRVKSPGYTGTAVGSMHFH